MLPLLSRRLFAAAAERIIGIDLGTTNSCVAVMEGQEPKVIANAQGQRTTPSIVSVDPSTGEILVGDLARRRAVQNPKNTFFATKRLIGRRFDSPDAKKYASQVPFDVVKADNGDAWVAAGDSKYSPAQIGAHILSSLKETAESYLDHPVKKAVVTVPAYFNDAQRQATKDAGKIAGLDVERIINEPTAASLAYGLNKSGDKKIAVYDLGGGTFDASILQLSDGVFEVQSTDGDTLLGGEDFDHAISDYIRDELQQMKNLDVSNDPLALSRIKEAAEKAKHELDSMQQTSINLPFIASVNNAPVHFETTMTKAKFESLVESLVQRTLVPLKSCLKEADLGIGDIDEVVMVGGMTRTPCVQQAVEKFFNKKPFKGVNPDEVVAMGAALQGSVLAGEGSSILLIDVTPLSLGIEIEGGLFHAQIPRNTTIPYQKTETFSTAQDNQTQVELKIAQGERQLFKDNHLLGEFTLDGIPPARRGVPKIEVAFDVDANGLVHVSAKNVETGKARDIKIKTDGGLSDSQIESMIADAEKNKEEDSKRRNVIELKNQAQQACHDQKKQIEENKSKVSETIISDLNAAIASVESAIASENVDNIESTMKVMGEKSTAFHQAVSEANSADQESSTPSDESDTTPEAEVVDTTATEKPDETRN